MQAFAECAARVSGMVVPAAGASKRVLGSAAGIVATGDQLPHHVQHALSDPGRVDEAAEDQDDQHGQPLVVATARLSSPAQPHDDDDRQRQGTVSYWEDRVLTIKR